MQFNRIFVKSDETVDISVYFSKEGNIDVLSTQSYKALPDEDKERYDEFRVTFKVPNFGAAKMIMRNSLDDSGNMHIGLFNNALLNLLAVSWNVTDENEEEIPVDVAKLNEMRPDIAGALVQLLTDKLDELKIYSSILLS